MQGDALKDTSSEIQTFLAFFHARTGRPAKQDDAHANPSPEEMWRSGQAGSNDIADALADYHHLPRTTFDEASGKPFLGRELSLRYLREAFIYPFDNDGVTTFALADPGREEAVRAVGLALGISGVLAVASFEEIDLLFERAEDRAERDDQITVVEGQSEDALSETAQSMLDVARGAPVVRLLDEIFERAVNVGATDIHLEAERDHLRVRLRVDGFLRRDQRLPLSIAPAVISRLKILAGLDIADRRLPQDGRANLRIGNAEADLRVAVMPSVFGEAAVVRILLRDTRLLEFSRIGMERRDQDTFEALLGEPHGIVVVTGPTGSGKTTTLATAISLLNSPGRKIVTVEDPVEYQIAGVHQTQIKPSIGLTFAAALRSFLRHDPDVIMVGEMRDRETASIGVQAALTGHLVLTTLHTNSACDAVVRLVDMGVEPYLLASSLRGVLGQRLVRRLCDRCKKPDAEAEGAARRLAAQRSIPLPDESHFHVAVGCDACGQTGFRGRIGVFEVVRADEELRATIRTQPDPVLIAEHARRGGTTFMIEDGLSKCARGLTTVEEVLRATG